VTFSDISLAVSSQL